MLWHCVGHQEAVRVKFLAVRHLYDTRSMRRGKKRARSGQATPLRRGSRMRGNVSHTPLRGHAYVLICRLFFLSYILHGRFALQRRAVREGYHCGLAIKLPSSRFACSPPIRDEHTRFVTRGNF